MSAVSTGLDDGIFPLSPSFAMDFAWLAPLPTYRGIQCPASLPSEALKGRTGHVCRASVTWPLGSPYPMNGTTVLSPRVPTEEVFFPFSPPSHGS